MCLLFGGSALHLQGFWGRRITIGDRCSINSNRILVVDVVKIVEVQVDIVAVVASVAVVV